MGQADFVIDAVLQVRRQTVCFPKVVQVEDDRIVHSTIAECIQELIDRLFQRRQRKLVQAAMANLEDLSLADRVAALADELDAQGYLADFQDDGDGRYLINLHGCAVWAVANRYNQACQAELGFIQEILYDATVRRVTHKTAGAHTCAYEITLPQ